MTKFFTKEFKMGVAGVIALLMAVFGLHYLKGINLFKPSSYYYVSYANINGLAKSSPVYADGFRVGIVRDIYYDYEHPGHVTVEVEMDTDMRVPKGSKAELVTEMLGTVKMNLLLANNMREAYQVGDTIPGVVNNGLMDVVGQTLMPMVPKLDSILCSLNQLLADPNIKETLKSTRQTMANLEATSAQLRNLMAHDVPQLTGKLNRIGDNFVVISEQLKDIDFAATFAKVDETMANLKGVTEQLGRKDNTIGLLLHDPSLYQSLNATGANAAALLLDLKEHPKRYVHFSLFGKKEKAAKQ
ncbi:MAG: MlaD family protein [Bacteroidaceae bacterium]